MGIFRRPRGTTDRTAITDFWSWWPTARARAEAGPDDRMPAELAEEFATRVHAVHPALDFELGQGRTAAHALTVTGGGRGELRGVTERWLRAAPAEEAWEFHAARPARPEHLSQTVSLEGHELDLTHVALGLRADMAKARVHVTAYHPDFLFLPEETRTAIAAQVLHWALGEDDVARWIGEIVPATDKPVDSLPPSTLDAVVRQIASAYEQPVWLSGEGSTPRGHPARVMVRFPLHRQDHPLCELHVAVSVPYANANPDRLPVDPSATALREFADKMTGLDETAVLAAHETGDGRRIFHLYADPDGALVARLDQLAADWREGRAKVSSEPDPGWRVIGAYLP